MDLHVLHSQQLEDGRVRYRMKLPTGGGRVRGLNALVQQVILHWMGTPGRDELEPLAGGGLLAAFRKANGTGDFAGLSAEVSQSVGRTEGNIKSLQATHSLPPSERLQTFALLNIQRAGTDVQATVLIRNESGEESVLTL